MLIEFKVNRKLPISGIFGLRYIWLEELHDVLLEEKSGTEDSHNLHDGTTKFEVMLNDADETVCDDCNMNLNADGILGFSPKGLDTEMLLDPLEELMRSFS